MNKDIIELMAGVIQKATLDNHSWGHCEYYSEQIMNMEIEREVECPACDGLGKILFPFHDAKYDCSKCKGTGKIKTKTTLGELIEHNVKLGG